MGFIKEDILQVAKTSGASVLELPTEQAGLLRQAVISKFARGKTSRHIWQKFLDAASVQDPNSWLWIDEYVGGKPTILFFDEDRETSMFAFKDGSQIVPVLDECPTIEFYLTDLTLSYVICFNRYDFLIADGAAADWLMAKRKQAENPPGPERQES